MSRWMVYKDIENGEWKWVQWVAEPAHEKWWARPQGRRFPQWDMAQRYADRMAHHPPTKPTWNGKAVAEALHALGYKQEEQE